MSDKDLKIKKQVMNLSESHQYKTITEKLMMGVQETQDKFIFDTIQPFVQGITRMEISKEELTEAVALLRACKEHGFDICDKYTTAVQKTKMMSDSYERGFRDGVREEHDRIMRALDRTVEDDK